MCTGLAPSLQRQRQGQGSKCDGLLLEQGLRELRHLVLMLMVLVLVRAESETETKIMKHPKRSTGPPSLPCHGTALCCRACQRRGVHSQGGHKGPAADACCPSACLSPTHPRLTHGNCSMCCWAGRQGPHATHRLHRAPHMWDESSGQSRTKPKKSSA